MRKLFQQVPPKADTAKVPSPYSSTKMRKLFQQVPPKADTASLNRFPEFVIPYLISVYAGLNSGL
jgi:hypothetical protein